MFLYIVPLKQGLKRKQYLGQKDIPDVFIHSSIKTRIETMIAIRKDANQELFLYIVPLKQGLKPSKELNSTKSELGFYT